MTSFKHGAFSAVRWTTFSMLGKATVGFLQLLVLVRLLPPSDFGLMAMAAAVIAIAQIVSDVGIGTAIIHHQDISDEALSSLYWANILISAAVMLLLMLLSPFLASLYSEPRIQAVLVLISTKFAIGAISQPLRSLAEKNLRFKALAIIDIGAAFAGMAIAIGAALLGFGVLSLVYGALANTAVAAMVAWIVFSREWKPDWRLRWSEIASFYHFGIYTLGFSVTNALNAQADILIGGRVLGPLLLGVYSVPKDLSLRLAMLINPVVTRVGFPVMAKAQHNVALLKSVYLKTIRMTASINFPIYMMLAVFAPEVVHLLLGKSWQQSVPILQILSIWGLVRSTGSPAGSLVFAMGKTKLAFWWSLCLVGYFAVAAWIGSSFGVTGLAVAMLISMILIPVPQWLLMVRPLCGAGLGEFAGQLAAPFLVSAFAVGCGFALASCFESPTIRLWLAVSSCPALYLWLSSRFNGEWFTTMKELILGAVHFRKSTVRSSRD